MQQILFALAAVAIIAALVWVVFLRSSPKAPHIDAEPVAATMPATDTATTPDAPDEETLPPLSDVDKKSLIDRRAALALPAAGLQIEDRQPDGPLTSRIGGPVSLPKHLNWPSDSNGKPLVFFAQINFDDMPPLDGFPTRGILYFFHGADDLYGADFDAPRAKGEAKVLWWDAPDASGVGAPVLQDIGPENYTPLVQAALTEGRAMTWAETDAAMPPTFSDFRIEELTTDWWKRDGGEDFMESLHDADWDIVPNTYVGGHPRFTQWDLRNYGQNRELTRVLFQAGSNEHFMWGDVGEAVFMISEEDLAARRFDRAVFWWDCH